MLYTSWASPMYLMIVYFVQLIILYELLLVSRTLCLNVSFIQFKEVSPAVLFPIWMLLVWFWLAEAFFAGQDLATLDKGSSSEESAVNTTQGI